MNDNKKEPLVYESITDLRNKLTKIYHEGGLEGIKAYISDAFAAQRAIELAGKTVSVFDVQLNYLADGEPGNTILDFKHSPTPENSRLFLTINLIEIEPNLQLIIRKAL